MGTRVRVYRGENSFMNYGKESKSRLGRLEWNRTERFSYWGFKNSKIFIDFQNAYDFVDLCLLQRKVTFPEILLALL